MSCLTWRGKLENVKILRPYDDLRWRLADRVERIAGQLGGRFLDFALVGPDLVALYRRVIGDQRVTRTLRGELIASVLYVVSPLDLIPEALFGPLGLIDDAVILTRLFDTLLNRIPNEVVEAHWPGDPETLAKLQPLARDAKNVFGLGLKRGLLRAGQKVRGRALAALRARLRLSQQTTSWPVPLNEEERE